jgi:hypothetical protein
MTSPRRPAGGGHHRFRVTHKGSAKHPRAKVPHHSPMSSGGSHAGSHYLNPKHGL